MCETGNPGVILDVHFNTVLLLRRNLSLQ